ncbi:MAG: phage replisome organizer N-terminal domain-containing protein [Ignavibacteriales bacterium]|nr:phage replisome organizer N-terminal domain-containing protein [Ignavibacteriales bacterium]
MDISWIKLKTKMFDDEKIQLIEAMPEADAILVIWIKLLILAGKANSNGYILLAENIPYSPEMLSTIFRRPLQIIKFALKILKDFGMIEVTESNVMLITNWEKHQNIEGLDRVREQNRLRQSKHRNKKPALLEENKGIVTLPSRDVTQQIKNKNKDIDKEKDMKKKTPNDFYFESIFNLYVLEFGNLLTLEKWKEWVDYRLEIKHKLTKSTAERQMIFLSKQPDPLSVLTNQSLMAGRGCLRRKTMERNWGTITGVTRMKKQ